ncbi:hypothetical protein BC937DRAFT_86949 [Endogone sp. FLAS-F59071]|nr:hypothetical protein BC937DRAFT_86949 [Endogone sp. FLAS-F59071]|eukprot:RUS19769.1 hypothetical protein BC937DRAFT_86949 [Endogone sp. FLAS-F59071]
MTSLLITLTIKSLEPSATHAITVPRDASVFNLKERICAIAEVNPQRQRLIFQGRVLKDDKNLTEYGLDDGKVIHLVVRPDDAPSNQDNDEPQAPSASRRLPRLGVPRIPSILPSTMPGVVPGAMSGMISGAVPGTMPGAMPQQGFDYAMISLDTTTDNPGEIGTLVQNIVNGLSASQDYESLQAFVQSGGGPIPVNVNSPSTRNATATNTTAAGGTYSNGSHTTAVSSHPSANESGQVNPGQVLPADLMAQPVTRSAAEEIDGRLARATLQIRLIRNLLASPLEQDINESVTRPTPEDRETLRSSGGTQAAQVAHIVRQMSDLSEQMMPAMRELSQDLENERDVHGDELRRRIEQQSRRAGHVFSRLTQLQNYMAPILAGARVEGTTPGEAEMRIGNPRGPANSTASRQPAQLHPSQQRQHTLPTGFSLPFSPNFRPFGFPTLPSSLGQQGQQVRMSSAAGTGTAPTAPAGSALQIVDISILSGPGGTIISSGGNTNGSALPTFDRRNLGGSANMAATLSSGTLQQQQASATSALQAAMTGSSTAPVPTAPSSTNDQRNTPATGGVGVDPLTFLNYSGETLNSRRIINVSNLPALTTETTLVDSAPLGASTAQSSANTATAATTSTISTAMGVPSARFDSAQLLRAQAGQLPAFQQTGTSSSSSAAQSQSRNTDQEPDTQIQALSRFFSSLLPGLAGAGLGVASEAAAGDASTSIQGAVPASANSSGQSQEQRPARFRTSGVMVMTGGSGDEWTTLGSWPMVFGPSGVMVGTGNGASSPSPGASAQRQQRRDQSGSAATGANSSRPAVSSRPPRSSPARSSPSPLVSTTATSVPPRHHRHGRLRAQDAVYSLGRIGRLVAGVLRILDQPREDGSSHTLTDVLRDPNGQPMIESILSGQLMVIGFDGVSCSEHPLIDLHQVDADRLRDLFHQIGESLTVREARDVAEGHPGALRNMHPVLNRFIRQNGAEMTEHDLDRVTDMLASNLVASIDFPRAFSTLSPPSAFAVADMQINSTNILRTHLRRLVYLVVSVKPGNENAYTTFARDLTLWIRDIISGWRRSFFAMFPENERSEARRIAVHVVREWLRRYLPRWEVLMGRANDALVNVLCDTIVPTIGGTDMEADAAHSSSDCATRDATNSFTVPWTSDMDDLMDFTLDTAPSSPTAAATAASQIPAPSASASAVLLPLPVLSSSTRSESRPLSRERTPPHAEENEGGDGRNGDRDAKRRRLHDPSVSASSSAVGDRRGLETARGLLNTCLERAMVNAGIQDRDTIDRVLVRVSQNGDQMGGDFLETLRESLQGGDDEVNTRPIVHGPEDQAEGEGKGKGKGKGKGRADA